MFLQLQLSAGSKHNVLLETVKNIALTVYHAAYSMSITVNEDVNQMFTNVLIKFKLLAMSQIEWDNYLLGEEHQHDVVRKYITQIGA